MLRQRLLTIAILLPLFVWVVLFLPTSYFAVITAAVVLLGAWEWATLMGLRNSTQRLVWLLLVMLTMLVGIWLVTFPGLRQAIMTAAALWWVIALFSIRRFGRDPENFRWIAGSGGLAQFHPNLLFGMLGIIVLVPSWLALVITHGSALSGEFFVLWLLLLVWGADSGAYVAGRAWGRRKLAPNVSPGKSWEGVYGALVVAVVVAIGAGLWLGIGWNNLVTLVLLSLITVLFSIVGDLYESMIKRLSGVKDSGRLLPGHGGVLDRIDSLTAAAPVFVTGLLWQGIVP